MPFHVDYSTKRRTVGLRGVSPVQFIICSTNGTEIFISVTLNDYFNHRNVTFTWEQIEGNTVILSNYDQLQTSFPFSDTNTTDKIFRFYIDKDLPTETYIDARVYHTPISFASPSSSVDTQSIRILDIIDQVKTAYIPNFTREINPDVPVIPLLEVTFNYYVEQEILDVSSKIEVLYSPTPDTVPYILEGTMYPIVGPAFPPTYIANIGYYLFVLYVDYPGSGTKQYYSTLQIVKDTGDSGNIVHAVDDLVSPGSVTELSDIRRFVNILRGGTIIDEIGISRTSTDIIKYNSEPIQVSELDKAGPGSVPETTFIIKYNPSGIGSA